MNGTVLFPYNDKSTSPFAYYYAIELARKIKHNLLVISTYQPSDLTKSFFRWNKNDESSELKKQLHLKLLELNGVYLETHNYWEDFDEIKIKCLVKPGKIENVLLNLLKQKSNKQLLVDHKTFSEVLFTKAFINNIGFLEFKLRVIPSLIERFRINPELVTEHFNSVKKEIFSEYLNQTKLYNIPNDIHILKSELKITEFAN